MISEIVNSIIQDLQDDDRDKIFKESVEKRLNASLELYTDIVVKSCEELLNKDYLKVVKQLTHMQEDKSNE